MPSERIVEKDVHRRPRSTTAASPELPRGGEAADRTGLGRRGTAAHAMCSHRVLAHVDMGPRLDGGGGHGDATTAGRSTPASQERHALVARLHEGRRPIPPPAEIAHDHDPRRHRCRAGAASCSTVNASVGVRRERVFGSQPVVDVAGGATRCLRQLPTSLRCEFIERKRWHHHGSTSTRHVAGRSSSPLRRYAVDHDVVVGHAGGRLRAVSHPIALATPANQPLAGWLLAQQLRCAACACSLVP